MAASPQDENVDVQRDSGWNDKDSSPPVLWGSGGSEDMEEVDSVERDGSDCLVIGRKLLLPSQLPLNATEMEIMANERILVAVDQLRNLTERKKEIPTTSRGLNRRKPRRQFTQSTPTKSGNNDLSQQVAEIATQHPEYSCLASAVRQEIWDKKYRDHPNTGSRVDMRRYDVRMATYTESPLQWSLRVPSADQLARVGLYYLGVEDRVRCFSCSVELEEWGEEDPLLRHYLASKHCQFLLQDFPDQLNTFRQQSSAQQAQCYANTSLRLHSFARWPLSDVVTSYQLASVGFYYTGEGTKVICFSCGLEVREWRRGDVPLLVHCRRNPDCPFIKSIIKGAPDSAQAPTPVLKTLATGATNKPNFSDLQVRLKSFKKLSPAFPISREQLAEAGLFLLRLPDVMKCHSCETVLQDWVEGDTAVEKHRGASPNCPFLAERFPSKLTPEFDPDDLPAAQFNEKELEMMAHRSSVPSPSPLAHTSPLTQPTSLPVDSMCFSELSISHCNTLPSPHPSHSLTESSLPSPQPLFLSVTASSLHTTSGYHSMAAGQVTSSYAGPETLQSSGPSSREPFSFSSSQASAHVTTLTSSGHSSLPGGELGGKSVSLPPSYSQASAHPPQTTPTAPPYQPSSLPAGAECVVCMDRPLEMVFVPCGHICVCEICSSQITRCPMCRTRTEMAVKVYFPY